VTGKPVPLLFRWRRLIVADERLSATDRHVALTLALHMDVDGGRCHPGMRRLARETRRKTTTVAASIAKLEQHSYLKVIRAKKRNLRGWATDVNHYQAQWPLGTTAQWSLESKGSGPEGPQSSSRTRQSAGADLTAAPADECPECELPGGRHVAGCPKAAEAA
jgi:hypothetical protein